MDTRTLELLEVIDDAHDWSEGQCYSYGGTAYNQEDRCRRCGMRRVWESDRQNGVEDETTFFDIDGNEVTLYAASAGC